MKGDPFLVVDSVTLRKFYLENGLRESDLIDLEGAGLIQISAPVEYALLDYRMTCSYFDQVITVEAPNGKIPTGIANLSREGRKLAEILVAQPVDGFLEYAMNYFSRKGMTVSRK